MKDKALSQGAKMAINSQIEAYGQVHRLNLDSKKKSIDLEVMLAGEIETLCVHVNNYELIETNGHSKLIVRGITTSRTWVDSLAASYLEGKAFDIPVEYAKMLRTVL